VTGGGPAAPADLAWRCFPYDPAARPGHRFSPTFVPAGQTAGRFDLHDAPLVCYTSDRPEHAVAEQLQGFRGAAFVPAMLRRHGRPLALLAFAAPVGSAVLDLCDPATLVASAIAPDATAHHDRMVTQAIARRTYADPGTPVALRWWSALTGAWHTTVWFLDRQPLAALTVATPPVILTPDHPAVLAARHFLSLR